LSAGDLADEVARLFHLPRIALPDLLAAKPLAKHFPGAFCGRRWSSRFDLRKTGRVVDELVIQEPATSTTSGGKLRVLISVSGQWQGPQ